MSETREEKHLKIEAKEMLGCNLYMVLQKHTLPSLLLLILSHNHTDIVLYSSPSMSQVISQSTDLHQNANRRSMSEKETLKTEARKLNPICSKQTRRKVSLLGTHDKRTNGAVNVLR